MSAFVLTAALIHRLAPLRNVPLVKKKLEFFTSHKSGFDVLFIGSSRTVAGVIPPVFDATLQAGGISARSYNLAIHGMVPPEEFWMIRRVIRQRPQALKWMFIEVAPVRSDVSADNWSSTRNLYWRDWAETKLVFRKLWEVVEKERSKPMRLALKKKWAKRIQISPGLATRIRFLNEAAPHLALFVRNQVNFGLGLSFFSPVQDVPIDLETGYYSEGNERTISEAELPKYQERLSQFSTGRSPPADPLTQNSYTEILAEIRRSGITPVCFIAPTGRKDHFWVSPPPGEPVLAFNQPRNYPTLYDPHYRQDADHLNRAGAMEFSRLLAEQFAASLHQSP